MGRYYRLETTRNREPPESYLEYLYLFLSSDFLKILLLTSEWWRTLSDLALGRQKQVDL